MSIEVTWTEEPEDLSEYSDDDEYDGDHNAPPPTDEERWKQLRALSVINNRKMQNFVEDKQEPGTMVEAKYLVKSSAEESSYLCGLASTILGPCDPRINKVEDSATQITVTTHMDSQRDPMAMVMTETLDEWNAFTSQVTECVNPSFEEMPALLASPDNMLEDNRSFDGSIRSTRTTETHETERTAIETEWAPSGSCPRRSFRPNSPFQKWSRPTSPVDKESRPTSPLASTQSPEPQDIQPDLSLLEMKEANKDLQALGISPTPPPLDRDNSIISLSPIPDDVSYESYYEQEASLLSDPRNQKHMVKPVQSIEVIYDPTMFDEGECKRSCALWPIGIKRSRSRFYR